MLEQVKRLFTNALDLLALTVEEYIERAHGNSREDLEERLREAAERGAELALEKAALEDKLDSLRFNSPSLWKDEAEALNAAIDWITVRVIPGRSHSEKHVVVLRSLLDRCDHMPMTAEEMGQMAEEAIRECSLRTWDDVGKEVDEYEGSFCEAADNEGAKIASEYRKGSDDDIPF